MDAFRAVVTSPALRRVELSWAASITAYWAFIIALAVYAYDQGGAAGVGLVGVIRVLPAFIAAPFAGVLGDRYRRELLLVVLSFIRAGFMAATALVLFAGGPNWLIYALSGGVALMASTVRPMQSALLPQLAKTPEELTAANLVLTTVESSGIFLGPALGGILLAATNTQTVFAAAAVAFVVASVLLVGLKVEAPPDRDVEGNFMREFFGGFGAIASDRKLTLIVTLYGIQTFVAGSLNVLLVVASLELLDLGQSGVGFLNSAVGIGGLFGAVAAFALVGRQRLASDFAFGLLLWGIPIALIGIFPRPPLALFLLAIVGVGNTVVDVAALTLLQRDGAGRGAHARVRSDPERLHRDGRARRDLRPVDDQRRRDSLGAHPHRRAAAGERGAHLASDHVPRRRRPRADEGDRSAAHDAALQAAPGDDDRRPCVEPDHHPCSRGHRDRPRRRTRRPLLRHRVG